MNYMRKSDGSFYRILIAPISRSSIVLGQLLEAVLCTFLEVGILGLLSLLFSVRIAADIVGIFFIVVLIFFLAFFLAALSYSLRLILPNEFIYKTVMNAIVLTIFFLSTDLFPVADVHGIVGSIINLTPLPTSHNA